MDSNDISAGKVVVAFLKFPFKAIKRWHDQSVLESLKSEAKEYVRVKYCDDGIFVYVGKARTFVVGKDSDYNNFVVGIDDLPKLIASLRERYIQQSK